MDNASTLLLSMEPNQSVISLIYPDNGEGSAELPPTDPSLGTVVIALAPPSSDIEIRKGQVVL